MIPLTFSSGIVAYLQDVVDATPLECMLVALACPVMRVVRHTSGVAIYDSHCINFLQNTSAFSTVRRLP